LPIPKSSPRKNKRVQKKGAILVLTSTPIRERTETEKNTKVGTENTKEKGKGKGQVKDVPFGCSFRPDLTVNIDPAPPKSIKSMQVDDQVCEVDDGYQSLPLLKLIKKDGIFLVDLSTYTSALIKGCDFSHS